ncbi:MAG: RING finger protein [Planctomycetota bacterium]
MKIRLRSKGGQRCPLCRVDFIEEAEAYACPGCDVRYHRDCAEELGGCATLGCPRVGVVPGEETPSDQRRRARWQRSREAARDRRAGRARLQEEHREQAAQAGQPVSAGGFDWGQLLGELALGCAQIGCLLLSVVLGAVSLWAYGALELDPARLARAAQTPAAQTPAEASAGATPAGVAAPPGSGAPARSRRP